jgi:hypothetical protein
MPEHIDLVELLIFNYVILYVIMSIHDVAKSYMLMMRSDCKGFKTSMSYFFIELNTQSLILAWITAIVISGLIVMYDSFL